MAHRVGIIGGDGIGPEVTAEALKVVRAAGVALATTDYDLGGRRYLATGEVLPDSVLRYNAKQWSLKALPIDLGVKLRSAVIVTLKNRTVSPVVQLFVEHVRAVAKSMSTQSDSG